MPMSKKTGMPKNEPRQPHGLAALRGADDFGGWDPSDEGDRKTGHQQGHERLQLDLHDQPEQQGDSERGDGDKSCGIVLEPLNEGVHGRSPRKIIAERGKGDVRSTATTPGFLYAVRFASVATSWAMSTAIEWHRQVGAR